MIGSAAMLLSFDVEPGAIEEHDRWHTHEHLPERLSIPGFLRGTRWIADSGTPRYMVLYEVLDLETLSSEAYLERLENPTPWTRKMMPHYRGMSRGLCAVLASVGSGQGGAAALIRFAAQRDDSLHRWLLEDTLPPLPRLPGLGAAHLLRGARPAAMTNEQRLRGADGGVDNALIVTGYDDDAVAARAIAIRDELVRKGAKELSCATYRMGYSLAHG